MIELMVNECVTGKFGVVLKGEFEGVYFKAMCFELESKKVVIDRIESDFENHRAIKEALIWCGYADY